MTSFGTLGSSLMAHEIGAGDKLFTYSLSGGMIETDDLTIRWSFADDDENYQLVLTSKASGRFSKSLFFMEGGREPRFSALNSGYYCDHGVLFITLKTRKPPLADNLGPLIDTHAFREDTLAYLGTVPDVFEAITPLEKGVDIGFPYTMPQRYLVECEGTEGSDHFRLWFTDRAPAFRGFDPAQQ